MKKTKLQVFLSLIIAVALSISLIPSSVLVASATATKLVFKPSINANNPNAEVFMTNPGLTFAASGTEGLKITYDASSQLGYSNVILAFPSSVLETMPYLVLKSASTASMTGAPKISLFAGYKYGVAGLDQPYAVEPLSTFEITECVDIKTLLQGKEDALGYVYLDLYVVSSTVNTFDFTKFYMSSEKEKEVIKTPFKTTASANYTDGGYFAKSGSVSIAAYGTDGLAVTGINDPNERAIYAFSNSLLTKTPYFVFEAEENTLANLVKICVTKKWNDGVGDRELEVTSGINSFDLKTLLKDDETAGFFYITLYIDGEPASPKTVNFKSIYLSNTIPTIADVTGLEQAVASGNAINLTNYVDNSAKTDFKAKLEAANAVLLNPKATQAEVDAVKDALLAAINALSLKPNPLPLKQKVTSISCLSKTAYTQASYAPLEALLKTANEMLAGTTATQAEFDDMIVKLDNAKAALVPKASGKYLVLKTTKTAGDGSDGGWWDQSPGLTYAKKGDLGVSITYAGGNFSNVIWAIPTATVETMPYLIMEVGSKTYGSETPAITMHIGYGIGTQHAEVYAMTPVTGINGVQAFNIKELLKGKTDENKYVYINMYVASKSQQTVDFTRLYLSSTNSDKSAVFIPFLTKATNGSFTDGGYFAIGGGITLAQYGTNGIKVTGEKDRAVWAFPNGLMSSARYLVYEIEGDASTVDNINVTKLFDDNKPSHILDLSPGVHKIDLVELMKNDTKTEGYFYVTVTMKSGSVNFKSIYLSDGSTTANGNPGTGDATPVLMYVFFLSTLCLGVLAIKQSKSKA